MLCNKTLYDNKKMHLIIQTVLLFGIVLALMKENSLIMNGVAVLAIIYCMVADFSFSFLFLISVSIFENSFNFLGNQGIFFLLMAIIVKLILQKKRLVINKETVLFLGVIAVGLVNDCIFSGMDGFALTTVVLLLYVFLINTRIIEVKFEVGSFIAFFGAAYLVMLYYVLTQYGGFSRFLNMFMSTPWAIRFGQEYGTEVGGAMAIPIYSLLIISFTITMILTRKYKNAIQLVFGVVLSVVSLFLGLLTVSRSFFAGLFLTIILLVLLYKVNTRSQLLKKTLIIVLLIGVTFAAMRAMPEIFNKIIFNLNSRISTDSTGTGSRSIIYADCIQYLFNHPIVLIFGKGSNGYQAFGHQNNYLFSAGCHNYFLDIIMSFGLLGFVVLLILVFSNYYPKELVSSMKKCPISIIPFAVLVLFAITAFRTNSLKPHLYFFMTIMYIWSFNQKGEERYDS